LALVHGLIHPSAWKKNSPKFGTEKDRGIPSLQSPASRMPASS
jgi:hypothetical protein